jgi:hypothetical protein
MTNELDSAEPEKRGEPEESIKPIKHKKNLKKRLIIWGIVGTVVIGGGLGLLIWHESPSFCNAICHSPMDPYVASYEEGISIKDGQSGALLLVTQHKESAMGIDCLDCHEAKINEQIAEGMKWVSGDYSDPLKPMRYDGEAFCLRSGCHEGITSTEELATVTASLVRNPHESHMPNMACDQCHQVHEQSEMMCYQCHTDSVIPEGWKKA